MRANACIGVHIRAIPLLREHATEEQSKRLRSQIFLTLNLFDAYAGCATGFPGGCGNSHARLIRGCIVPFPSLASIRVIRGLPFSFCLLLSACLPSFLFPLFSFL
jgi:hypothetical protein